MQEEVAEYDQKLGWSEDKASHIVLHILEELGEVARHINRHEGYKKKNSPKTN